MSWFSLFTAFILGVAITFVFAASPPLTESPVGVSGLLETQVDLCSQPPSISLPHFYRLLPAYNTLFSFTPVGVMPVSLSPICSVAFRLTLTNSLCSFSSITIRELYALEILVWHALYTFRVKNGVENNSAFQFKSPSIENIFPDLEARI